jgi:hypothetical protein
MAVLARTGMPPLQGDAAGAAGTLSAPIRLDAPDGVLYAVEGLRCSAAARGLAGTPL